MNPSLVNNGYKDMMYGTPNSYKGLVPPAQETGLLTPMMYNHTGITQLRLEQFPGPSPFPAGFRYIAGTLAANGFIYAFGVNTSGQVLKLNPQDGSFTRFGSMGTSALFRGGVRAPNGKLYSIPSTSPFVAIVDPNNNDSITTIGALGSTSNKYTCGVLAPNGKIYCPPGRNDSILVMDTNNDTLYTLGSFPLTTSFKWGGAILASNGKIYCIPSSAVVERRIMVIDPKTDTFYFTDSILNYFPPNFPSTTTTFAGAVSGINNKIYSIGWNAAAILEVNPENDSIRYIPLKGFTNTYNPRPMYLSSYNYTPISTGGQLATNGKIYSMSSAWTSVNIDREELSPLEFDTEAETLNKLYGSANPSLRNITVDRIFVGGSGTMDTNGNIWFICDGAQCILKLSGFPPATPDMYTMPPLEHLATSLYNKFHNKVNALS